MIKNKRKWEAKQDKATLLEEHLYRSMRDLLWGLNEQVDRRLVKTFFGLVMAIIPIHDFNGQGGYHIGKMQKQRQIERNKQYGAEAPGRIPCAWVMGRTAPPRTQLRKGRVGLGAGFDAIV